MNEMTPDERFEYYLLTEGSGVNKFMLDLFIEYLNLDIQNDRAA